MYGGVANNHVVLIVNPRHHLFDIGVVEGIDEWLLVIGKIRKIDRPVYRVGDWDILINFLFVTGDQVL